MTSKFIHNHQKPDQQNKMILALSFFLISAGISVFLWMGFQTRLEKEMYQGPPIIEVGGPAVDFMLPALNGRSISLSDYQGDIIIMNIWATWCPPCRAEMPTFDQFYNAHKAKGLVVLAVNGYESEEVVRPFIETNQFTFPVLLDEEGMVVEQYLARSFPTTIVIDRNGRIQHVKIGQVSPQELDQMVLPLLH